MAAKGLFDRLFGNGRSAGAAGKRLVFEREPAAIYAIGDVHGSLDLLKKLETLIAADAQALAGEVWLLLLGDVIDRGPASAQVLDHLLQPPPPPFKRRYCLMGNHEDMMLDFLARPGAEALWLHNGGYETLRSYGMPESLLFGRHMRANIDSYIPAEHMEFLSSLPVAIETPAFLFAHAGVRPGTPLAQQSRHDLLWFRDDYASDYGEFDKTIVHGHTPLPAPLVTPKRIALDTGACFSGRLSAARLVAGAPPVLLATNTPP